MDCYKCAKESTGPWYCELCAESSSEPSFNVWEKPNSSTECTLCGGTTGAFRKATNGQWVHALCAEVKFPSKAAVIGRVWSTIFSIEYCK